MKDQVVMSKTNGQLAVAVPLFRRHYEDDLTNLKGYTISMTSGEPTAYVIDCDKLGCQLCNPVFAKKNLEFLGDL